jgi:hypothetical protein
VRYPALAFVYFCGALLHGSVASIPMPTWEDTPDVRRELRPGLWPSPDEIPPLDISAILIKDPNEKPAKEEPPGFDINATILIKEHEAPTSPAPLADKIPWDFMYEYVTQKPVQYLIDPQYLLGELQALDVSSFLKFHGSEAEFDIYAFVFEGYQEVGSSENLQERGEKWFPGEPSALLSYYLGEPQKTQLVFCGGLKESVAENKRKEILADCIRDSLVAQDPTAQFERFLTRLSVRLFWLQRELDAPQIGQGTLGAGSAEEPARAFWKIPGATTAISALVFLASAIFLGVAIGIWMMRKGTEIHAVHIFPIPEIAPRLGAPHSGGNSAMVRF